MKQLGSSFCSAIIFYTILPLPIAWTNSWMRIARWASLMGLLIGGILALSEALLQYWGFATLTRSAIVTGLWIGITGGLHLDGAMDTADGLATTEPSRRLEVMKDSATGAYGAIVAIIIILLKTTVLSEISFNNWLILILAAGWGRWGQLMAIALYPYAKKTGKGAFHKENLQIPDIFIGSTFVLIASILGLFFLAFSWWKTLIIVSGCTAIALIPGYYFYCQLQGHTGDTYGAVVEWNEVLLLLWLSRLMS